MKKNKKRNTRRQRKKASMKKQKKQSGSIALINKVRQMSEQLKFKPGGIFYQEPDNRKS